MEPGFLTILLHAHLPFVRHPEYDNFLEEEWLFEAITETYIPLVRVVDKLIDKKCRFKLTCSLSPTLTAMLQDEFLQNRYLQHLERLEDLAKKEVRRTSKDISFNHLAKMYLGLFQETRRVFEQRCGRDLVHTFAQLQDGGYLEIMTSCATHGFLPLLKVNPEAVRAQVSIGQDSYYHAFGRQAPGIWLPECGYYPGLEDYLREAGFRYFIVDSHGILNANVKPHYGLQAPLGCPNGIAAFARDPEASRQVWSAEDGYPSDVAYRDFYRDIGFDLDKDYISPYILDGKTRVYTGIKYYSITGKEKNKEVYRPLRAARKSVVHAAHFLECRKNKVDTVFPRMQMDRLPHILAPYDAELFGHWWFEGPQFLYWVIRQNSADRQGLFIVSPSDYLDRFPIIQRGQPSASSWGWEGYNDCWLSDCNDWVYPHVHRAAKRMIKLADSHHQAKKGSPTERCLNQAARSLLLAQASDWSFILKTKTSVEYAQKKITAHLGRFQYLCDSVENGAIDERKLHAMEIIDNIFPFIDFRIYQSGRTEATSEPAPKTTTG